MKTHKILVSHDPKRDERDIFMEVLGDYAHLTFLSDVPDLDRADAISEAEVLISWSPLKELRSAEYQALSGVRFIQFVTAGVDHVPFSLLPPEPAVAGNIGAYAEPMAEHVLAMALAMAKRLFINHSKLRAGEFDQVSKNIMLHGLVCGILGYGGIGRATARLMRALGLKIYALNTSGRSPDPVDFVGTLEDLGYVLHNSDLVVVAMPLTNRTKGLLGDRELSWMKPDAILINVARGGIIHEGALYRKLECHPTFMAAIDTWWIEPSQHGEFRVNYPFFDLPNFLGSPHNSPVVPAIMLKATRLAAQNVLRFLRGEPVSGGVSREEYV